MDEKGLNRLELLVSVFYAAFWALIPASCVAAVSGCRHSRNNEWFPTQLVPPTVSMLLTGFTVVLVCHLLAATGRVPRQRLDPDDKARMYGVALFSVGFSILVLASVSHQH